MVTISGYLGVQTTVGGFLSGRSSYRHGAGDRAACYYVDTPNNVRTYVRNNKVFSI